MGSGGWEAGDGNWGLGIGGLGIGGGDSMDDPLTPKPGANEPPSPPLAGSSRGRLLRRGAVGLAICVVVAAGLIRFTARGRAAWVWVSQRLNAKQLRAAEQQASAALVKRGAPVVVVGPSDKSVTAVTFYGKPFDAATGQQLIALYRVQTVNLTGCQFSDDQLGCFAEMPQVQSLVLQDTPITDRGLEHLGNLPNLSSLQLSGTRITDAGLAQVARMQNLLMLELSHTKVTDAGMASLAQLPRLHWLVLSGDAITDAGLAQLEALPSLGRLSIQGTKATRQGIARLKQAKPGIHVDF